MKNRSIIQAVVGDDEKLIDACLLLWQRGEKKLTQLYGDQCQTVIEKCYDVSPYFCFQVLTNVYGIWWSLDDISDYQKSLVTNVALLVTNQLNQFNVLIETYYASGGNKNKLKSILAYLQEKNHLENSSNEILVSLTDIDSEALDDTDKSLIELAACTALQKDLSTLKIMETTDLNHEQAVVAINHLLTYLGCPRVWDATIEFRG